MLTPKSSFGRLHRRFLQPWVLVCLLALVVTANCAGLTGASGAPAAVEAYLQALIARDSDSLSTLSCADWEEQARQELDSFAAVTARLQDLKCQESGTDGDFTLVTCSGKIVANYNGEDQEIDLDERTYQAISEAGDWRMCGYR